MARASSKTKYLSHLEELLKYPDYSLTEWLAESTRNSIKVPEKLAMKLLDFGSTHSEWQHAITTFLGDEGTAFGAHKSKWMFVLPFTDEKDVDLQWNAADPTERAYLLRWLRDQGSAALRMSVTSCDNR